MSSESQSVTAGSSRTESQSNAISSSKSENQQPSPGSAKAESQHASAGSYVVFTPRYHSPPREHKDVLQPEFRETKLTSRGVLPDDTAEAASQELPEPVRQALERPGGFESIEPTLKLRPGALAKLNTMPPPAAGGRMGWLLGYRSPRSRGVQMGPGGDWKMTARGYVWVGDDESLKRAGAPIAGSLPPADVPSAAASVSNVSHRSTFTAVLPTAADETAKRAAASMAATEATLGGRGAPVAAPVAVPAAAPASSADAGVTAVRRATCIGDVSHIGTRLAPPSDVAVASATEAPAAAPTAAPKESTWVNPASRAVEPPASQPVAARPMPPATAATPSARLAITSSPRLVDRSDASPTGVRPDPRVVDARIGATNERRTAISPGALGAPEDAAHEPMLGASREIYSVVLDRPEATPRRVRGLAAGR